MFARQMHDRRNGTADGQVGAEVNARLPSQTPGIELTYSIVRSVGTAFSQVAESSGASVLLVGAIGFRRPALRHGSRGRCATGWRKHPQHQRRPLFTDELLGEFAIELRLAGDRLSFSPRLRRMNRRPTWPATRESSMATATGPPSATWGLARSSASGSARHEAARHPNPNAEAGQEEARRRQRTDSRCT